jgi:hypothetical protein
MVSAALPPTWGEAPPDRGLSGDFNELSPTIGTLVAIDPQILLSFRLADPAEAGRMFGV